VVVVVVVVAALGVQMGGCEMQVCQKEEEEDGVG
jgi:hypothetical protein